MSVDEILIDRKKDIFALAAKHGARNIQVFGSAARGDAGPQSDIDFLVELESDRSLMDQIALTRDLEDLLGRRVDVVEPEGLHWYIKEKVLAEAVPL